MKMTNKQYGDALIELMDKGWSAEKAVMGADLAYAIASNDYVDLKSDETVLHREEGFYGTDVQDTMKVIDEVGKVAKSIKEMASKAKSEYLEMREYLSKKAPLKNELAELKQKVERAMGKSELTLELLSEKSQSSMPEISQRIDLLESKIRGGASVESIAEPMEEAQADYTPSFDLDHYDSQLRPRHDPYEYHEGKVIQGTNGGGLAGCIEIGEGDWRNSLQ